MIIDNHDVGRLQMTMHESALVKIVKRVEYRHKHLAGFGGRQRPLGKNLGEIFIGIFRYGIKQQVAADSPTSGVKDAHQARMREGCR